MNHTPSSHNSRSGSFAPDLEPQPILESSRINGLTPLPRIWADCRSDSAVLRIAAQFQHVRPRSRSGVLIPPYYVGGCSAPCGARSPHPYVGGWAAGIPDPLGTPHRHSTTDNDDDDDRGARPATEEVERGSDPLHRPYPHAGVGIGGG